MEQVEQQVPPAFYSSAFLPLHLCPISLPQTGLTGGKVWLKSSQRSMALSTILSGDRDSYDCPDKSISDLPSKVLDEAYLRKHFYRQTHYTAHKKRRSVDYPVPIPVYGSCRYHRNRQYCRGIFRSAVRRPRLYLLDVGCGILRNDDQLLRKCPWHLLS